MAFTAWPSANANSYSDVADADTYIGDLWDTAAWTALTTGEKQQALVSVTAILDRFTWAGERTSASQDLAWPRTGAVDRHGVAIADSVIPDEITRALWVGASELAAGRWDLTGKAGAVTSVSSGAGVSVTFSGGALVPGAAFGVPQAMFGELAPLLAGRQGALAGGAAYGTTDADGDDVVSEYIDPERWGSTEPL